MIALSLHRAGLGESPAWSLAENAVYWTDWEKRCLLRTSLATGTTTSWPTETAPGSLVLRQTGGLVVALADGFHHFEPASGRIDPICDPEAHDPRTSFNDGKCDARGRFWAGTMDNGESDPCGSIYRLDHDLRCHRMIPGIVMTNGIAWSPDGRRMYFADSVRRTIFACDFDLDDGIAGPPKVFATVPPPAVPDGATVDAEGCLWSAQFGAGCLARFDPLGRRDRTVTLPVQQPTSCIFGGRDAATLYVTTARYRLDGPMLVRQPLAGSLLALDVGVRGLPEPAFGG